MIQLSDRIQGIAASATFAIKAKASALKAQGRSVIDLSTGEPDGQPPSAAVAAGLAAIEAGEAQPSNDTAQPHNAEVAESKRWDFGNFVLINQLPVTRIGRRPLKGQHGGLVG